MDLDSQSPLIFFCVSFFVVALTRLLSFSLDLLSFAFGWLVAIVVSWDSQLKRLRHRKSMVWDEIVGEAPVSIRSVIFDKILFLALLHTQACTLQSAYGGEPGSRGGPRYG